MKHCNFMLGNTSSGFVEASYFAKPVINLGDRQKGRFETPNIITTPIEKNAIIDAIKKIRITKPKKENHIYGDGNTAKKIVQILKQLKNS